jgi:hypothetical protein
MFSMPGIPRKQDSSGAANFRAIDIVAYTACHHGYVLLFQAGGGTEITRRNTDI